MANEASRDESLDVGIDNRDIVMRCAPWHWLAGEYDDYDRYVPYVELMRVTKERDALKLELDKRDAEKSDPIRGFCDSFFGVQP